MTIGDKHRHGHRAGWLDLGLRLGLAVFLMWCGGLLWFALKLPGQVEQPGRRTDGIAVLTGGGDRIRVAVELMANRMARRLMISGVNRDVGRETLRRLASGRAEAFDCCVDVGREALDTAGNAVEIARWAERHDFRSLRVVTASYHIPRSLLELRRVAGNLELVAHPVFPESVELDRWWARPGTLSLIAGEYGKYLLSLLAMRATNLAPGLLSAGGPAPEPA